MHEKRGDLARRAFLTKVTVLFGGLVGVMTGVPIVGHLLGPVLKPSPELWIDLGPTTDFPVGQTKLVKFTDETSLAWAGLTEQTAVWATQSAPGQFTVWAVNCTHLGCPVNWLPDAKLFECPCHGGVYYADGSVAAGPPPHALFKHPVRVQAGVLQAQTFPLPTA